MEPKFAVKTPRRFCLSGNEIKGEKCFGFLEIISENRERNLTKYGLHNLKQISERIRLIIRLCRYIIVVRNTRIF